MALKTAQDITVLNQPTRIGPIGIINVGGLERAKKSYTKISQYADETFNDLANIKKKQLALAAKKDANSFEFEKLSTTTNYVDSKGNTHSFEYTESPTYLKSGKYYNDSFNELLENRHANKTKDSALATFDKYESLYQFDEEMYLEVTNEYLNGLRGTVDPILNHVIDDILVPKQQIHANQIIFRNKTKELDRLTQDTTNIAESSITELAEFIKNTPNWDSKENADQYNSLKNLMDRNITLHDSQNWITGDAIEKLDSYKTITLTKAKLLNKIDSLSETQLQQVGIAITKGKDEVKINVIDERTGRLTEKKIDLKDIFKDVPLDKLPEVRVDIGQKITSVTTELNKSNKAFKEIADDFAKNFVSKARSNLYGVLIAPHSPTRKPDILKALENYKEGIQQLRKIIPTAGMSEKEKKLLQETINLYSSELVSLQGQSIDSLIKWGKRDLEKWQVKALEKNPAVMRRVYKVVEDSVWNTYDHQTKIKFLKEQTNNITSEMNALRDKMQYINDLNNAFYYGVPIYNPQRKHKENLSEMFLEFETQHQIKIEELKIKHANNEEDYNIAVNDLKRNYAHLKMQWITKTGVMPTDLLARLQRPVLDNNPKTTDLLYRRDWLPYKDANPVQWEKLLKDNNLKPADRNYFENYHNYFNLTKDTSAAFEYATNLYKLHQGKTEDELAQVYRAYGKKHWLDQIAQDIDNYKSPQDIDGLKDVHHRMVPNTVISLIESTIKAEIASGNPSEIGIIIEKSVDYVLNQYSSGRTFMRPYGVAVDIKGREILYSDAKRYEGRLNEIPILKSVNLENSHWQIENSSEWLEDYLFGTDGYITRNGEIEDIKNEIEQNNPKQYKKMIADGKFEHLIKDGQAGNFFLSWDGDNAVNPSYNIYFRIEDEFRQDDDTLLIPLLDNKTKEPLVIHNLRQIYLKKAQEKIDEHSAIEIENLLNTDIRELASIASDIELKPMSIRS